MSVENTGTNQFENVSGSVEGENELAQQLNQTVPQVNGNVTTAANNTATEENNAATPAATPAAENNTATPAEAPAEAPPVTTSGYVMSAKAKDLQTRRKALFEEMKQEYTKVFGDDKKAPKAKMYHAAGLLTIKERDGDEAYMAKLQEYIDSNRGKYTNKTRKVSPSAAPAASPSTASPIVRSPESAAESGRTIIRTIETMASKVKEMVDTMVSTTRTLVKSDKPDMAAIAERVVRFANESATGATAKKPRKPRSNKGSTHKRKPKAEAEAVNE